MYQSNKSRKLRRTLDTPRATGKADYPDNVAYNGNLRHTPRATGKGDYLGGIKESRETSKNATNQPNNEEKKQQTIVNQGKKDLALPVPVIVPVALLDREEAHVVLPAPARRPHGHLGEPP